MDGMGCFNSDPYISMADFFQRLLEKRGDTTPDGSSLELKVPLQKIWVVVSSICCLFPLLAPGKWSNSTSMIQMGWNHRRENLNAHIACKFRVARWRAAGTRSPSANAEISAGHWTLNCWRVQVLEVSWSFSSSTALTCHFDSKLILYIFTWIFFRCIIDLVWQRTCRTWTKFRSVTLRGVLKPRVFLEFHEMLAKMAQRSRLAEL